MSEYQLSSDADLKTVVRGLTMYEDTTDELPESDLDTQIRAAKIKLDSQVESTDWYSDNGLSKALLGATLIYAKCAVENYSITRWDIGGSYIDVSGKGDTDVPQFNEWAKLVSEGLQESSQHSSQVPSFSKTYIGN